MRLVRLTRWVGCLLLLACLSVAVTLVECDRFTSSALDGACTTGGHCVWRDCAVVSTDHGGVLDQWLFAAKSQSSVAHTGLAVLHVDAHADMNVPEVFDDGVHNWNESDQTIARIQQKADLASFQLAAVWAGLIDNVIWVKPTGSSNVASDNNEPWIIWLNQSQHTFEAAPRRSSNAQAAIKSGFEMREYQWQIYRDVEVASTDLEDAIVNTRVCQPAYKQSKAAGCKRDMNYILDIDLDHFIAEEFYPGSPPWGRSGGEDGFNCRDATLGNCGREMATHPLCEKAGWTNPDCPIWKEVQRVLADDRTASSQQRVGFGSTNLPSNTETRNNISIACSAAVSKYMQTLQMLPKAEGLRCLSNFVWQHEWVLWADHICRENSLAETHALKLWDIGEHRLDGVERLLKGLSKPPVLVTIARSSDHWTPVVAIPKVEAAVLKMLKRVFPNFGKGMSLSSEFKNQSEAMCATYTQGTSGTHALIESSKICDL